MRCAPSREPVPSSAMLELVAASGSGFPRSSRAQRELNPQPQRAAAKIRSPEPSKKGFRAFQQAGFLFFQAPAQRKPLKQARHAAIS